MEFSEILEMIGRDVARIKARTAPENEETIDSLLADLQAVRESGEGNLEEKYKAVVALCQFLERPGNMIKILDCKDQLTLGECLPLLSAIPSVRDTEFETICTEAAFHALYSHFLYGNILEKGFAAVEITSLLSRREEALAACFGRFLQMAALNDDIREQMDEEDFRQDSEIRFYQLHAAMIPFIRTLYDMYPNLGDEDRIRYCDSVEEVAAKLGFTQQQALKTSRLFHDFVLTEIKDYNLSAL